MKSSMKPRELLKKYFLLVLATVLYQNGITGVNAGGGGSSDEAARCECQCPSQATDQAVPTLNYYYNPSTHQCEQGPANCSQCVNTSFTSQENCQHTCNPVVVGGCRSTRLGCCPDQQTPRSEGEACPSDEAPGPPSNQIRWDLIAAGICGVVLLLAVVTVVGMATYVYRQKHKQRHRRYIQEVLQMYDDNDTTEDDYSDSSVEDNPERNNLFDRLSRPV